MIKFGHFSGLALAVLLFGGSASAQVKPALDATNSKDNGGNDAQIATLRDQVSKLQEQIGILQRQIQNGREFLVRGPLNTLPTGALVPAGGVGQSALRGCEDRGYRHGYLFVLDQTLTGYSVPGQGSFALDNTKRNGANDFLFHITCE